MRVIDCTYAERSYHTFMKLHEAEAFSVVTESEMENSLSYGVTLGLFKNGPHVFDRRSRSGRGQKANQCQIMMRKVGAMKFG